MLSCHKYGRLLALPLKFKTVTQTQKSFLSRITSQSLKVNSSYTYKLPPFRSFSTANKEAAANTDEDKKNKAQLNEKKLIDTSLNEHKALKDTGKQKTSK